MLALRYHEGQKGVLRTGALPHRERLDFKQNYEKVVARRRCQTGSRLRTARLAGSTITSPVTIQADDIVYHNLLLHGGCQCRERSSGCHAEGSRPQYAL